jgi:hypothetical protein
VLVFGYPKDDETNERRSHGQSLFDEDSSDYFEIIHPQRAYRLDHQDPSLTIS